MTRPDISVIVMTFNEELHLRRCLESVTKITDQMFVVDCFSTDRTVELAKELGAEVIQHKWPGLHAVQFNWALDNLPIRTKWVLRLDADEYLTKELAEEIRSKMPSLAPETAGIVLPLRRVFMNRIIKRGTGPIKIMRLFQYRKARYETRMMDEHLQLLEGEIVEFENEFADHNLNDLGWWTQKHNLYAIKEAIELLDYEYRLSERIQSIENLGKQAAEKRKDKLKYARLPLFFRSFAYFFYRYFIRLGFLDGKAGFLWHFLQGWWYRTLVDARIWEVKKACGNDREKIRSYIKEKFHYEI